MSFFSGNKQKPFVIITKEELKNNNDNIFTYEKFEKNWYSICIRVVILDKVSYFHILENHTNKICMKPDEFISYLKEKHQCNFVITPVSPFSVSIQMVI